MRRPQLRNSSCRSFLGVEELEGRDQPSRFTLIDPFPSFLDVGHGLGSLQPAAHNAVPHSQSFSLLVVIIVPSSPVIEPDSLSAIIDLTAVGQPTTPSGTEPAPSAPVTGIDAASVRAASGGATAAPLSASSAAAAASAAAVHLAPTAAATATATTAATTTTPAASVLPPGATSPAGTAVQAQSVNSLAPVAGPDLTRTEVAPAPTFAPFIPPIYSDGIVGEKLSIRPDDVLGPAVEGARAVILEVAPPPRPADAPPPPAADAAPPPVADTAVAIPVAAVAELPAALADTGGQVNWYWTTAAGLVVAAGGYWAVSRSWLGRKIRAVVRSAALTMLWWTDPPAPSESTP
ncbi:MAG TPA: hypothetical protein VKE74_24790 [Gemmataceae bacterium]|nr:hypothetical protein [Gemmataceae bacterium]